MGPLALVVLLAASARAQSAPAGAFTQGTEWAREAVGRGLCGPETDPSRQARGNLAALASTGNGVLADERGAISGLLQDAADVEKGFHDGESAEDFRARVRSVADRLGLKGYEDSAAVIERCLRSACAASPGGARCTRGGKPVPPPAPAPPGDAQSLNDARARGARMASQVVGFGAAADSSGLTGGSSAASARPAAGVNGVPLAAVAPTSFGAAGASSASPVPAAGSGAIDYSALNRQARSGDPALSRFLNRPVDVPAPGAPPPPGSPEARAAAVAAAAAAPAKPSFARPSEDEIALMRKTFDATVARLVREGKRTPGDWEVAALWNDLRSAHGSANLMCYDQAHELLHDLAKAFGSSYDDSRPKDQLYFYDSTGKWRFVFTTYTGEGHEADGHYWVTAISRVPADDTVIMDPWAGKFERTKEKNPVAIKGFFPYWYGRISSGLRGQ